MKVIQNIPQRNKKMKHTEKRLKVQDDGERKINMLIINRCSTRRRGRMGAEIPNMEIITEDFPE